MMDRGCSRMAAAAGRTGPDAGLQGRMLAGGLSALALNVFPNPQRLWGSDSIPFQKGGN